MATNKSKDMIDINATREEREKALEPTVSQSQKKRTNRLCSSILLCLKQLIPCPALSRGLSLI